MITLKVRRGYTAQVGVPFDTDDVNAGFLPTVQMPDTGLTGTADIEPGAIDRTLTKPDAHFYGDILGTDTYTLDLDPGLASLSSGAIVCGKVQNTNTGAATLSVDGISAKAVIRRDGTAVRAGDLRAASVYRFQYDGTSWVVLNPTNPPVHIGGATAGTSLAYTLVTSPTVTALYTNARVQGRIHITNIGNVTLAVDGLAAKAVLTRDGGQLAAGDLILGQTIEALYDPTALFGVGAWILTVPVAQPLVPAGTAKDLKVLWTSVTQVTVTARQLVVADGQGQTRILTNVSVVPAITGSGANGLDTGAEAPSTLYRVWVIWNNTTVAGLLSLDASSPTMPSGYSHKALVGAVWNGSGSDFEGVNTYGDTMRFRSAELAVPTNNTAGEESAPHQLGAAPRKVFAWLVCKTGELGYAVDDQVDLTTCVNSSVNNWLNGLYGNATTVGAPRDGTENIRVFRRDAGGFGSRQNVTKANWRIVLAAEL